MPLSKGGKYFSRPADAARHDAGDAMTKDLSSMVAPMDRDEIEAESPATGLHILKTPEGFQSVSHHEDGSVQQNDHASFDDAMEHGKALFADQDADEADEDQMGHEPEMEAESQY